MHVKEVSSYYIADYKKLATLGPSDLAWVFIYFTFCASSDDCCFYYFKFKLFIFTYSSFPSYFIPILSFVTFLLKWLTYCYLCRD